MNSSGKKPLIPRGIPQPFVQRAGHKPLVAQPKSAVFAQIPRRPVAPPVYKPQPQLKIAQPKFATIPANINAPAQQVKKLIAPPVYRPQATPASVQAKPAGPTQIKKQPGTPVCRVQSIPKVLQTKKAMGQPAAIQLAVPRIVRPSNTIQRNFARGTPVEVFEGGRSWFGVITAPLHYSRNTYQVRVGGTNQQVEVRKEDVDFHSSIKHEKSANILKLARLRNYEVGRLEERRDGDSVVTAGGRWTAVEYFSRAEWIHTLKSGRRVTYRDVRGLRMKLQFTPNDTVDAERIVLVQTVKVTKDDAPHIIDTSLKERWIDDVSIDQDAESASPEYAAAAGDPDDPVAGFGAAPVQHGTGEHGYRYHRSGQWHVKPAWIQDDPHIRGAKRSAGHKFETTAIAAAGNDEGRYYGSVEWGYFWTEHSKVKLIALRVVEAGNGASAQFRRSAIQWNRTLVNGKAPAQIPVRED